MVFSRACCADLLELGSVIGGMVGFVARCGGVSGGLVEGCCPFRTWM